MINFAHGDLFMVGAFFCFLIAVYLKLSFVPTLLLILLIVRPYGILGKPQPQKV
jgi:branched-chain amino acid transport system permease protein